MFFCEGNDQDLLLFEYTVAAHRCRTNVGATRGIVGLSAHPVSRGSHHCNPHST